MVFKANGAASFPESFRIQTLEVSLSLMVTSAPLWLLLLYLFLNLQIVPLNQQLQDALRYQYD